MSDLWVIGLDAWIVQDGNYPDFARGERRAFAVEFWPVDIAVTPEIDRSATNDTDAVYRVAAELAYDSGDAWVLDCGIRVYCEGIAPEAVRKGFASRKGSFVTGTIALGIDPFFYFETLNRDPGMPELIYSWTIERIQRQNAPFVDRQSPASEKRPRLLVRDAARLEWVDVEATDAWDDDDGYGEYLLHCRRLDVAPTRALPDDAA